jgi:ABC-type transport system involved in cytochrome bd biosynthesis fused ATPase/permease subunit
VTSSPLLLDQCDLVGFLDEGQLVATGRHRDLLASEPRYRACVLRGED